MADIRAMSFLTGALKANRELQVEEEKVAREEVAKAQEMQQAIALERYKSQMDRYNKDSEMARKLEAAGSGATFAQVYYSGLAGIPADQVRKDLDPTTDVGKKNMEWFNDEKNRNAVLSYLKGAKPPEFKTNLADPEFEQYVKERRKNADVLVKLYRKATGIPVKKLPNIMESKLHEKRMAELFPKEEGLTESFRKLGITPPGMEVAPDEQKITPITYYKPDGTAVKAFTIDEARKYEEAGLSAASTTTSGTKGPITLFNKQTGDEVAFRSDNPMVDVLLEKGYTTSKPRSPEKVKPLQKNERDQVAGSIQSLFESKDSGEFADFVSKWDEADRDERPVITNAIFSEVARLKAQPEYMDDDLETLTNVAIQNINPRIKVSDVPYTLGAAQSVTLEPKSVAPMDVQLAPNEVIRNANGKMAVFDATTKQFKRWVE